MELKGLNKLLKIKKNNAWKVLCELPDKIERFEIISDDKIVVQTHQGSGLTDDRNIFLVDLSGNVFWQIEKAESPPDPYHPGRPNPYCGFKYENGRLYAYSQFGFDYEVNLENGKVSLIGFNRW
ncbi:MAG: hypothetical protein HYS98_09010 [Deltaproteobacteria bacterium]|nr:hypothetical protein [Deltaproteobacteria bacterium]